MINVSRVNVYFSRQLDYAIIESFVPTSITHIYISFGAKNVKETNSSTQLIQWLSHTSLPNQKYYPVKLSHGFFKNQNMASKKCFCYLVKMSTIKCRIVCTKHSQKFQTLQYSEICYDRKNAQVVTCVFKI